MKTLRQSRILELIRNNSIETQSELIELLRKDGFHVTQATISRDIKEMRLIKILDNDGTYRYASEKISESEDESHSYLLATAVVSIDYAHALVVIKTRSGMAQAVCAALDATNRAGILGSIAGDDTIFIAAVNDAAASNFVSDLRKLISNKNNATKE